MYADCSYVLCLLSYKKSLILFVKLNIFYQNHDVNSNSKRLITYDLHELSTLFSCFSSFYRKKHKQRKRKHEDKADHGESEAE